jgi:hypothetical protein
MRFLHRYGALWSLFLYFITRETHQRQLTYWLWPARWRREGSAFEDTEFSVAKQPCTAPTADLGYVNASRRCPPVLGYRRTHPHAGRNHAAIHRRSISPSRKGLRQIASVHGIQGVTLAKFGGLDAYRAGSSAPVRCVAGPSGDCERQPYCDRTESRRADYRVGQLKMQRGHLQIVLEALLRQNPSANER